MLKVKGLVAAVASPDDESGVGNTGKEQIRCVFLHPAWQKTAVEIDESELVNEKAVAARSSV